jgi:IS5 family transposase
MRKRLTVEGLAELFNRVRDALRDAGLIREVFTFVDATHLISKSNLWKERDRLIAAGEKRLNNTNIGKVATDSDARLGKKGGFKWYGYKFHVSVDMSQGLIARIATTPANVMDEQGARHVLPRSGMVFADKGYCAGDASMWMKRRGLHSGAILRKQMRGKNPDRDRWISGVRAPYEGVFSQFEKRARYQSLAKCQFQGFMEAFTHNLKRLVVIQAPPLKLRPHYA